MVFVIDANTRQPVCNKLVQIIRCNKQSTLRRTFVKIKMAFFIMILSPVLLHSGTFGACMHTRSGDF